MDPRAGGEPVSQHPTDPGLGSGEVALGTAQERQCELDIDRNGGGKLTVRRAPQRVLPLFGPEDREPPLLGCIPGTLQRLLQIFHRAVARRVVWRRYADLTGAAGVIRNVFKLAGGADRAPMPPHRTAPP